MRATRGATWQQWKEAGNTAHMPLSNAGWTSKGESREAIH